MHFSGGIYADIDLERCGDGDVWARRWRQLVARGPASLVLLRGPTRFERQHRGGRRLTNFFVASSRGHPFWRFALGLLRPLSKSGTDVLGRTGPGMLTTAWEAYTAAHRACERERDASTVVLEFGDFQSWVGAHRFAGSWHVELAHHAGQRLDFMKPNGLRWLGVDEALNCVAADSTVRRPLAAQNEEGLAWIHVGKSGGLSLHRGLMQLAKRGGLAGTLIQIHGLRGRWDRPIRDATTNATVRDLSIKGPYAAAARPPDLAALLRRLPILLWVRDPVSRAVSCWLAFFDGATDAAARLDKRRDTERAIRAAAAAGDDELDRVEIANATDLGAVLSALAPARLDEVRARVLGDWRAEREAIALERALAALRQKFTIVRAADVDPGEESDGKP